MHNIITERSAISALEQDTSGLFVIDLMGASATRVAEALQSATEQSHPVVLLSCQGVEQPTSEFLTVMAEREGQARNVIPEATVVRMAPLVEDLAVYEPSFLKGAPIYHSYPGGRAAWITASDLGAFLTVLQVHPDRQGRAYQLNGAEEASAQEIVTHWGELRSGSAPEMVHVPVEILTGHLETLMGAAQAAMIAGHQGWCGDRAALADRTDTLERALGRTPRSWQSALAHRFATV